MFDSNCKKTFHSQALNRLTVLERLTWLIPVGFIVREIIYTHSEIEEVLHDSPSPAVIIALIIAILFVTALQAGFWFLLAKVLFHFARKQIMRNNSFITVEDLDYYRVHFDVWSSEQAIRDAGKVEAALEVLKEKGLTYEKEGALWFETTRFGDDKDRVLRKTDGSYTYLVPDIAYHKDKMDRGYDLLVDFFGADHHGYVPRLKASIAALGNDPERLAVDIIQMVRLVENGQEVKMSKRLGNAVTIRELCDEVGVDAARYFFVQRALDTHLDFDLGLARSQSNDNPVYYAQYAHARMCSILRQAQDVPEASSYERLTHEKEADLMKYINEFTSVVSEAARLRAPHKVCNYIQKLAQKFHSFYNACKVIDREDMELSAQRLDLVKAARITLGNALELIGVEAPEKM